MKIDEVWRYFPPEYRIFTDVSTDESDETTGWELSTEVLKLLKI